MCNYAGSDTYHDLTATHNQLSMSVSMSCLHNIYTVVCILSLSHMSQLHYESLFSLDISIQSYEMKCN